MPTITTDHTTPRFDMTLAIQESQFRRMMKRSDEYDKGLISFEDLDKELSKIVDE